MLISIRTTAYVTDEEDQEINDTELFAYLQGHVFSDARFTDFMDTDDLIALCMNLDPGGFIKLSVSSGGLLAATTTYNSKIDLDAPALRQLTDYTLGQWSDGIGECLELSINGEYYAVYLETDSDPVVEINNGDTGAKGHCVERLYRGIIDDDLGLLQSGVDNGENTQGSIAGATMLEMSVFYGRYQQAEVLLDNGAAVASRSPCGDDILAICAAANTIDDALSTKFAALFLSRHECLDRERALEIAVSRDKHQLTALLKSNASQNIALQESPMPDGSSQRDKR